MTSFNRMGLLTAAVGLLLFTACSKTQLPSESGANWEQLTASSGVAGTANIQSLIQPGMY